MTKTLHLEIVFENLHFVFKNAVYLRKVSRNGKTNGYVWTHPQKHTFCTFLNRH